MDINLLLDNSKKREALKLNDIDNLHEFYVDNGLVPRKNTKTLVPYLKMTSNFFDPEKTDKKSYVKVIKALERIFKYSDMKINTAI